MSITRRLFLRRSASAATAAALVATTLPAETATELPVDRVHQLARELALAMNDWCVDLGCLWVAHVYPSEGREHPICFENVTPRRETDLQAARRHLYLAAEHMNRNSPGKYRVEMDISEAFAIIIDDTATPRGRRKAVRS